MTSKPFGFIEDIKGRVEHNTSLPYSKGLMPLYEAISNSIDAIEENDKKINGHIDVRIIREEGSLYKNQEEGVFNEITGFHITDNGIGFTNDNFNSFITADSQKKAKRGGKGVGRFIWLKAFDYVKIDSIFTENDATWKRSFHFSLANLDGMDRAPEKQEKRLAPETTVTLAQLKDDYKRYYLMESIEIARKIVEHFLSYFITTSVPTITLIDVDKSSIQLNDLYNKEINSNTITSKATIKGEAFTLHSVLIKHSRGKSHELGLCAKKRVVEARKIKDLINDLPPTILFKNEPSVYYGYLESSYLEKRCNQERTRLDISETTDLEFPDEISRDDIANGIMYEVKRILNPHLEPITKEKKSRINEYINREAPQYRPIVNRMPDKLDEIKFNGTDYKGLDLQLHKLYLEAAYETRQKGQKIMEDLRHDTKLEEYETRIREFLDDLDDINKSDLARYVGHRRAVISFLKYCRGVDDDGKNHYEDAVHNLIYPMGKTSHDIDLDMHNLWLIDERLSFHRFIASDTKITSYKVIESDSKKEPDVAIFNEKYVFAEDAPIGSVILLEFKRPGRDDYSDGDNPIDQLIDYVMDIRDGKIRDSRGAVLEFPATTPFYCYCIADITPTLKRIITKKDMIQMPDAQGYYYYHGKISAYIEVLSINKVIQDAEKRNRILFEKLGLPPSLD